MITIFTDGSSRGNPGRGGWGSVVVSDHYVADFGGREDMTTNNRMELVAAIRGLGGALGPEFGALVEAGHQVKVNSDSSYVINGITKWVFGWVRNDWVSSQKEPVLNKDLWQELLQAVLLVEKKGGAKIRWNYVGGHVGIIGNERCDEIATSFADNDPTLLYVGPRSGYGHKNILDIDAVASRVVAKKSSKSKGPAFSYVSRVGGVIETHNTWVECEARVKGAAGARFKKAMNATDEAVIKAEFAGE